MLRRIVGLPVLCLIGLAGCGSNFKLPTSTAVSIDLSLPANTTLLPGQTAQFSASVSNSTNTGVYWEVNGVVGGNSQFGTISTTGLYTAPSTLPASAVRMSANAAPTSSTVIITAAAQANTSASANATVTLIAAPVVSISPSGSLSLLVNATQQFTSTVTNSSNTAVDWQVNGVKGGSASTGTISPSGLYQAPAAVPNPSSVTVTAVSVAYAGASASTSVTIAPLPPVVTVSPGTVSVPGNTTQQFNATVTNTANTAVTWQVNTVPGGNATVGTISASGLYTAPAAIPNPATVTVSAVSVANTNSVGSAAVTITTPEVVTVSPPSVTVQLYGTQQFTGTSSIPNDTLSWQVNGVAGGDATFGTITSAGLYTAPTTAPSNPLVVIKAISGVNPSIFGSATVSIGTAVPTVTVTPASKAIPINTTQQFSAAVSPSNLSQTVQWEVNGIAGGNTTVGTINASGLYTAPLLVPTPTATVTISAVSNAAPNLFGTASVTVTLPSTPISVSVTPSTVGLMTGQSQTFSAAVSPSNNPAVTWTVSSVQYNCVASASNACGTIDNTGNYTAPVAVPGGGQSANVSVTATSVADPTKSGSATVTITPTPAPTVSINAGSSVVCSTGSIASCTPLSATFTAVPNNFPGNAQLQFNWTLGCINSDEDADYCDDPGDKTTGGDNGVPELDGPGDIQASGGGTPDLTVSNSPAVIYFPPKYVFSGPAPANGCPAAGSDQTTKNWAYVPITVSTQYNGVTYTSQPTCVEVIYQYQ
jgi:hypothetical protein